ncbi:MAG TPA: DUF488 family protein [Acidimicrobiales bacterium]|jgi:uncharacterized protein YeaO (DUF488 family)/DNA-binding MarR family transcriptional regulator
MGLVHEDYARLLALRNGLRRFLRWSEQQAEGAGLTPNQHQLLLAIRGHDDPRGPTIGEVADYLLLRHHSIVELVDRADSAGLVTRHRDDDDRRVVRLQLTDDGADRLEALSAQHLEELGRLALQLPAASKGLVPVHPIHGLRGSRTGTPPHGIRVARVYDYAPAPGTAAVLVDRLWPRGLSRAGAPFDVWLKDLAPSTELRRWYGHVPDRYPDFAERYRIELRGEAARQAVEQLHTLTARQDLVLLTAAKDVERSGPIVLRDLLTGA